MTIQLERKTGWFDTLLTYRIYLDSELVGTIASNEIHSLQLPQSHCQLKIKKDFQKAASLEVVNGDNLVIKPNRLGLILRLLYYLGILGIPLISFLRYSVPIIEQYQYFLISLVILDMLILMIVYITHPTITIIKKENL
ncbi:hypothetical protein AB6M97_03265 [Streptococcus hillyeri]|uniref:Uncharacterized protein n=1 Tax=Streptococcus hillyeri TaxID=2282420 RepID=A0A3L9DR18_9STRE|nr:hypothetical protein [Streptococcus hillyeri]RLY02407.1 hypothetical protein EAF07_07505 [Streptococcus hillyeri]